MTPDDPPTGAGRRLGVGAAVVVVIVALAVTVGIGVFRSAAAPVEEVSIDAVGVGGQDADAAADVVVYVHVTGAVAAPGLYPLASGSRVVDAVSAAGGFATEADQAAVNLARPMTDGEQLHVPVIGEAPADAVGGDGRVNLNSADAALLDTLPRIGAAMAARIIEWRESNGAFTSVEDLLAVPGIGDKMLETLRDLVTV